MWSFLFNRESLWGRVIHSLYGRVLVGEEGIRLSGNSRRVSSWWKGIVDLGSGEGGKWFWDNIEKVIGDGGIHCFGRRDGLILSLLKFYFLGFFLYVRINSGGSVRRVFGMGIVGSGFGLGGEIYLIVKVKLLMRL